MNSITIKKYFKQVILLLSGLLVLTMAGRLALNYSGYCYAKGRYLSDQEHIDLAVQYIFNSYPPVVDIFERESDKLTFVDRMRPIKPIMYSSIEEFYRVNENCCEITRTGKKGYTASMSSKLAGGLDNFVRVKYRVKYEDSDGDIVEVIEESFVAMTNCGYPWSGI